MIVNVPIEPLEERYSGIWYSVIPLELSAASSKRVTSVLGKEYEKIESGQFLDVHNTISWKTDQLSKIVAMIKAGVIGNNDVIFFNDLWFPGLEALFYIRNGTGVRFKIAGMFHAGTWDEHDWTHYTGMTPWARHLENCWLSELDAIFVATEFHKTLITSSRLVNNRIFDTGFPRAWDIEKCQATKEDIEDKKNIVVFPHRLALEKQPQIFDDVAQKLKVEFPDWYFIKSKDICTDKDSYYSLLKKSKIAVSTALQETWGIAMQEATIAGCIPAVPDRLSYDEMYNELFKYSNGDLIHKLRYYIQTFNEGKEQDLRNRAVMDSMYFKTKAKHAIDRMVMMMKAKGWNV